MDQSRVLRSNWEKKKKRLNGWEARIVQHEYDHLNGVLFIDRHIEMNDI